jgi:hypothetical protein
MIEAALERLAPGGVLCAQFGEVAFEERPNRTTRFLATAREAFRRRGTRDFSRHVLVGSVPGLFTTATILLKAEPFTPEEVERFVARHAAIPQATVRHPADGAAPAHPVGQVISLGPAELERWLADHPYSVGPVRDDSPFFWHFTRFRDVLARPWGERTPVWDPEDATGERMLVTLLGITTAFGALFLLLPLAAARERWREVPHKAAAAVYFAALGLGFMFFEVAMIQRLVLFLGHPTYSLSVTLFALLVASGLGSLAAGRSTAPRGRLQAALVAALAVLALFHATALGPLFAAFEGASLAVRAAWTVVALAPLGFCLGAFLPLGLRALVPLSAHPREYVAWGFAVNGFFSVVSSVLATILSMAFGFRAVLALAVAIYAIGVAAFWRVPGRYSR